MGGGLVKPLAAPVKYKAFEGGESVEIFVVFMVTLKSILMQFLEMKFLLR